MKFHKLQYSYHSLPAVFRSLLNSLRASNHFCCFTRYMQVSPHSVIVNLKNQDANHNIQAAVSFRCSIRRTNSALDLSCPNDAPMSLSESYELLDFQNLWFLPCVSSKLPHICFLRPVINDVPARSTKLWRLTSFLSTSTRNYEFKHLKLHLIYTKI
jgi:hypothetical protein